MIQLTGPPDKGPEFSFTGPLGLVLAKPLRRIRLVLLSGVRHGLGSRLPRGRGWPIRRSFGIDLPLPLVKAALVELGQLLVLRLIPISVPEYRAGDHCLGGLLIAVGVVQRGCHGTVLDAKLERAAIFGGDPLDLLRSSFLPGLVRCRECMRYAGDNEQPQPYRSPSCQIHK